MLTGEPRMQIKSVRIGHLGWMPCVRAALRSTIWSRKTNDRQRLRGGFQGGNVEVDGSVSSQFLTALLMTVRRWRRRIPSLSLRAIWCRNPIMTLRCT
ncbi:hypothetical protein MJ588_10355 [Klebsiella pneumoniae]|nr:hypothetical protein MJ588_10355 [Klebsiella pneumoniae]